MPRLPRAEFECGLYHVYSRGNRRQPIYLDDKDRRRYLNLLERVTLRMRWRCLAFCLMGNHVHMLVETRTPNLGFGMQRLHSTYAAYFNARHEQVGHLFQGRFKAPPIESDVQLWVTAAYIACNPVAAGLCREPAAWPWSSHTLAARNATPDWLDHPRLVQSFTSLGGDPRERYLTYVDETAKLKGQSL
jgi:REP element-mobilizing transposase RayT